MTPPYLSYLTADGAEPTGWHHVSQSNVFDRTGFPLTLLFVFSGVECDSCQCQSGAERGASPCKTDPD